MAAPVDYTAYGPFYAGWARALSLLGALVLSGLLLAMPQLVAVGMHELDHGTLSAGLWGISGGFVHGVGYVPEMRLWRYAFSPYLAWPLMGLCIYWWFVV
ncbi:MAG: cyd operon YbgE family protein [Oceanobacter sp.]|jgi:predicted membrane protein